MDTQYGIDWGDENHENQIITESRSDDLIEENNEMEDEEYLVGEEIIPSSEIITISNSLDQIAAENLIYMAQDGSVAVMGDLIEEQVDQVDNADYNEQQYFECHVTEEVITDDWVQQQGEDRVEVPVDQLTGSDQNEEVLVPLPTDEYTTLRPYPCDFCSRRFRKKANLTTHMVAHKNVKPHACNLCGARYLRKMELMEHLKHHAQIPHSNLEYIVRSERDDDEDNIQDDDNDPLLTVMHPPEQGYRQRRKAASKTSNVVQTRKVVVKEKMDVTKKKRIEYDASDHYYEGIDHSMVDEDMTCDGSRPFVCNVCGVSFTREKALNSHIALHGIDNVLECETCNEVFWSAKSLEEHQKMHEEEEEAEVEDEEEEEVENSGSEYDPNAESDEDFGTDYGSYYCKICGMAYHRLDLLKRHARTHKDDNNKTSKKDKVDTHCCNVCGSIFKDALDLLAHGEVHTRANLHKCTLCGETFTHEKDIKNHIATIHAEAITETTCRLCGKHCKDERTLLKHAWDHSKEKNHSCNKCGKTFHNRARLNRHMQSHRNKSVACNVCGETFPDGRSLMNHRHSHTNLSGRQFPCRECGKTFGSRSSQQIHMRIHTGERPYGCRYCWKAFADGGTLRKHERIHTGEKPYACPVCPRAFNQRVVLREHIRSHHSAPDANYEGSTTPFYCTVCGNLFRSSSEIIQHLIEHSDANTESNRQPVLGPRKYKRRRKLKPEELEVMRRINKNDTQPKARPTRKTAKTSRKSDAELDYKLDEVQEELAYETSDARNDEDIDDTSADETHLLTQRTIVSPTKTESINETTTSVFSSVDEESDDFTATTTKRKSPNKKSSNISTVIAPPAASSQRSARVIHTSKKRVIVETKGGKTTTKLKTIVTPTTKKEKTIPIAVTSTRKSSRTTKPTIAQEQPIAIATQSKSLTNGTARTKKSSPVVLGTSYSNNSRIQNNVYAELSVKSTNYSSGVVSDLEEILGSPIKTTDFITVIRSQQQTLDDDVSTAVQYLDHSIKPSTRSSKRISARGKQMPTETISKASPLRTRNNRIGGQKNAIFMEEQSDAESSQDTLIDSKSESSSSNVILNIKQEREVSYTMIDETNLFTCEMCSAVFSDRAQLLVHVPVHI